MTDQERLEEILDNSPDSIYVTDKNGVTIYVNKAFETLTSIPQKEVLGRNVNELEAEGYFNPSVLRLVLEEKRSVSILQKVRNGKEIVVSGVPVFDEAGQIKLALSNAKQVDEMNSIYAYYRENRTKENRSVEKSPSLICESKAMKEVISLVNQVKDTDSTILITGESGVGKGVLTRYIHAGSRQGEGKLVEINCGAIPENLLESELFGYESGAFTGASSSGKQGLIELAEKGTLFLDEIGELPLMLQVKLLKVIQDKQILRIGGKEPIDVDVRIIAATNRNLTELVSEGKFRKDLYYRLSVIPVEIPPLRERQDDIIATAEFFLDKSRRKYNKEVRMTPDFLLGLQQYSWPGNIRELENFIERKVLIDRKGVLERSDILENNELDELHLAIDQAATQESSLQKAVEILEQKMVCAAYEKYRSSYKVAEVLGISQTNAYRKIQKYVK